MTSRPLRFAGFVLDLESACLQREGSHTNLSPKDLALLHYLVSNPQRVIPHAELLDAVWRDTAIHPDVLKVRIARLRRLLGDNASAPRFIANVHGEGYRFLARQEPDDANKRPSIGVPTSKAVGRSSEVAQLNLTLAAAAEGRRQVVVISGEAGIGKTTLIDAFIGEAVRGSGGSRENRPWLGTGQCLEFQGESEPFLPIMDALGQLARSDERGRLKAALAQFAPSWLLQLPALVTDEERASLQRRVVNVGSERAIREIAEAFEALDQTSGAGGPDEVLVLVIEDIQWADVPTLDVLRMLARRREPLRLLIVASYRPGDMDVSHRPLGRWLHELRTKASFTELPLGPLTEAAVVEYLDCHFPGNAFAAQLAVPVQRRTGGHPLFVADIVRDLRGRAVIVASANGWLFRGELTEIQALMPASVRQLMARQRDELSRTDRQLLEAASVAGLEFPSAAVAAAIDKDTAFVEARCLDLAERQLFIQPAGVEDWPDGTRSMRFAFLHALHQELWRDAATGQRGQQWRLRIGSRLEFAYAGQEHDIAGGLAVLFEQGRDLSRASRYYTVASHRALQRGAHSEARDLLSRAFGLLSSLPDSSERQPQELRLRIELGSLLSLTEGFRSPGAADHFERADALCRQVDEAPGLMDAQFGLCRYYWIKGDLTHARRIAEQMMFLALSTPQSVEAMVASTALGSVLLSQGHAEAAIPVLEGAHDLSRSHWRQDMLRTYSSDLQTVCASSLGNALWLAGRTEEGRAFSATAAAYAAEYDHPISRGAALLGSALQSQFAGDPVRVQECVDGFRHIAATYDLPDFIPLTEMFGGWVLATSGQVEAGLANLTNAVGMFRGFGVGLYLPYALGLLAGVQQEAGDLAAARASLDEALEGTTRSGGHFYEAELLRRRGELATGKAEAEADFERGMFVARAQGARSWKLRTALSLARSVRGRGDDSRARAIVAEALNLFTDGDESREMTAAREFLNAPPRSPS